MKILQLIQRPQLRGAEIFASQLSNYLSESGHNVMMVCLTAGASDLPFRGKILFLNRPLAKRFIDIIGWKQLARIVKEFKPDIIQANAGDTLKFAVLSKLIFRWRAPIIFRNANKVSDFIDSKSKLFFNKVLVKQVTHVISVSELCRQDFIKAYDVKADKISMVPIGIELDHPDSSIPTDLISFFSEGKVLLNVASFVPEKNHTGLLRMVKQLIERHVPVKILIVGDGRQRDHIQNLITQWGLEKQIHLAGIRTNVLNIMTKAHAFLLPSLIEGLPAVILEAMYCRVPVIAYDVGGIPEVVKHGVTGWLVNAGDEVAFVNAIVAVMENKNYESIIENAHQLVVNEFDNRKIAQRFLAVYHQVAARTTP